MEVTMLALIIVTSGVSGWYFGRRNY